jgi:class 3 adenylate cyclase
MVDDLPKTRFAALGDDSIAYQVFGEGDVDLIYLSGIGDCIDVRWEWPSYASFLRRLAAHARVIMFDQRGSGASDDPSGVALPHWERWVDDAQVVLDAVDSERVVVFGGSSTGPTAILYAVTQPSRARGLILLNTGGLLRSGEPGESGYSEAAIRFVHQTWGTEEIAEFGFPDAARDPAFRRWKAKCQRLALNPREASIAIHLDQVADVRQAVGSVRVPTLVMHREGYMRLPIEQSRRMAEQIPGARFVVLPGNDAALYTEPMAEGLDHVEEFLKGLQEPVEPDRALAAILFTDIVGSTEKAPALGDREWRNLLETHDAVAKTVVEQHRGRLVKMTGDGVLATFDGPGRAIQCAIALGDALRPLGLQIRVGLHTGEIEVRDTDIAGIGVHIAARVLDSASPGEVLVSAAVPMLVAGSGIAFEDRGEYELKGVSDVWRLFAVSGLAR